MRAVLADRRSRFAFMAGCLAVTAGVLLHLPMLWHARHMNYHLAGMPMDGAMLWGMAAILGGSALAAWGLLPGRTTDDARLADDITIAAPEDAPLSRAHWRLMAVLVCALIIDIMKPAALGFTVPGMTGEYRLPADQIALLPFSALTGTVIGSIVWGGIADLYGRKASILLSAILFVGTAICGAMPSFGWNVFMCFMMGAAAGGMLPVTYALLAEMMPSRQRGWALVLVGGLGAAGGYFAASGLSALLQPIFGWRVMWLLNLPTGLLLVALGRYIPESAKFLMARGRIEEARAVMAEFGAEAHRGPAPVAAAAAPATPLSGLRFVGKLAALSLVALAWGFVNFGILLWLPADLVASGYSIAGSSQLIAASSLIAFPTVFAVAFLYSKWSSKKVLIGSIAILILGLCGLGLMGRIGVGPLLPLALVIVATNAIIAVLLPYAAESFPLRIRGRTTGWVAACSKAGGLIAQTLGILALVPALGLAALGLIVPSLIALALVWWFGQETKGRDLRGLEEPLRI